MVVVNALYLACLLLIIANVIYYSAKTSEIFHLTHISFLQKLVGGYVVHHQQPRLQTIFCSNSAEILHVFLFVDETDREPLVFYVQPGTNLAFKNSIRFLVKFTFKRLPTLTCHSLLFNSLVTLSSIIYIKIFNSNS
jgi:hypothetical protein